MRNRPLKINLGCGTQKIPGFIGIDCEKKVKPDLLLDFRKEKLPYKDESVDELVCFHTIEHIERKHHLRIFSEVSRILKRDALFYLSYPDFWICANNWKANVDGKREYWHATMFGLQMYPSDYHVSAIDPTDLMYTLRQFGFVDVRSFPEKLEKYNKITVGRKGDPIPLISYETLVAREFNDIVVK